MNNLNFGEVLIALKGGKRASRKGWNGKDMWIKKATLGVVNNNNLICTPIDNPCLVLKNVKGDFNTWIPSITDLFAEDWEIVD